MACVIDANVFLEVLYKRGKWEESRALLEKVKAGAARAYVLHFTLHGISALLGKPELVSRFLAELSTWRGIEVVETTVEDEILACELAGAKGLDFDDGLVYYLAKRLKVPIVSYDRDFDGLDVERLEPGEALRRLEER
ncbi:MAG: PIN domain-containing protein [Thermofilaceae archaeon]